MKTFLEFVDKQEREAKKQLSLVKKLLENQKMNVGDHLDDEDPYIFVKNPANVNLSFDGIRIYKIGDTIAYRVQRQESTHPYGKSYLLDIEEMFNDLMSEEDMTKEKAGKEVIKSVAEEIQNFFRKSVEAEAELKQGAFDQGGDPLGRGLISTTGSGYSNLVHSTGTDFGGAAG